MVPILLFRNSVIVTKTLVLSKVAIKGLVLSNILFWQRPCKQNNGVTFIINYICTIFDYYKIMFIP